MAQGTTFFWSTELATHETNQFSINWSRTKTIMRQKINPKIHVSEYVDVNRWNSGVPFSPFVSSSQSFYCFLKLPRKRNLMVPIPSIWRLASLNRCLKKDKKKNMRKWLWTQNSLNNSASKEKKVLCTGAFQTCKIEY